MQHPRMKTILPILLLATLFPAWLFAQEPVLRITVVERENEFYVEQMKLWKAETEKNPQNKEAWKYLYHAARYKDFPAVRNDEAYRKEVDQIVADMQRAIPNSFESHYIYAWHNGFGDENFDHLMKAYAIDPSHPKIAEDLFTHHYARGEWDKADEFMRKWYGQKTLAPQLLHFCYNLLACTEEKGILFLAGDNDSYPTWMLQTAKNHRPDVAALNAYILMDKDFARKAMEKYGIKVDESAYEKLSKEGDVWQKVAGFIEHIAENNPDRKVYIPMTMPRPVQDALGDNLYVVGSLFQYCGRPFDNIAILKRNWSRNMKLDYLDFMAYGDGYNYSPEGLPYTVIVYMYPAVTLYHHYKAAGEDQRAEEMLDFAKDLSVKLGKPDDYKRFVEALGK